MTMIKHGNTIFAGDRVVRRGTAGVGKVMDTTTNLPAEGGVVRVKWSDGSESDEAPSGLEKAEDPPRPTRNYY
jgi:hypothetical protein